MRESIRELDVKKDEAGNITSVGIVFGPHYFVEVKQEGSRVKFVLGATHHGFEVDASEIGQGLEEMIYAIREKFPETAID
ncbi:hypothetical protein [Leptolinea tardivitalis]|uniref:Uncharacterized protein n=1 Tax=Leptolinea tardivitalis TaxID=229920 RepID=A0A0P6XWM0_9CHLR|nr:hypothetical protein [Leptolinea tardivitalis]KPL73721.1 hypothetical protein ADM99_02545 [Leptolinea tardivitalis]GAP22805.1 hypothetical protein LTAR_03047 [Leptolinea tardivitalis]